LAAFLLRRLCDPHIKHIAVLIHSSPERVRFPVDLQIHLIHMSLITRAVATMAQFIGRGLSKFETPLPHRFIGHDDPALCEEFLNRTEN
jgi:hypothetical protein